MAGRFFSASARAFSSSHHKAARYLSTSAFYSAAAAKTGWSTTGMPSTIIRHNKSALVNSVGSKPPTFSSLTPNKHDPSWEAILARRYPSVAAWVARTRRRLAPWYVSLLMLSFWYLIRVEDYTPDTSDSNILKKSSDGCSVCCNCQCRGPKT